MYKIIMVCTGNICRSPMAERLLRHFLPGQLMGRIAVGSAGTYALHGQQASSQAIEAMRMLGVDLSDHRAHQLTRDMIEAANLILAMKKEHLSSIKKLYGWGKPNAKLIGEFVSKTRAPEIEDPYGGCLKDYQTCIAALHPCLEGLIAWLGDQPDI